MTSRIAWGAKVSAEFLDSVVWIVNDLDIGDNTLDGVDKLMTCMAWESGRSFSPSKKNLAGSGATGLIQFMPSTAVQLGTTTAKLAKMTAVQQLNYVWKYFAPYKGRLRTLADIYMAILWPAAVGKPETHVLWDKDTKPTTYRQNSGLDVDKDAVITKAEAASKVAALLTEGLSGSNVLVGDLPDGIEERPDTTPNVGIVIEEGVRDVVGDLVGGALGGAIPGPVGDILSEAAQAQIRVDTPDATATVSVEPNTTTKVIKEAVSGWPGNFAGIAAIAGALLLNPDFAAQLGAFTVGLSRGDGSWGALAALIGAALLAYRHRPSP